jgi:hypothetical protein
MINQYHVEAIVHTWGENSIMIDQYHVEVIVHTWGEKSTSIWLISTMLK